MFQLIKGVRTTALRCTSMCFGPQLLLWYYVTAHKQLCRISFYALLFHDWQQSKTRSHARTALKLRHLSSSNLELAWRDSNFFYAPLRKVLKASPARLFASLPLFFYKTPTTPSQLNLIQYLNFSQPPQQSL
jgi:hypothetical protein